MIALPRAQLPRLVERGGEEALLDVLVGGGALQLAAQHLARRELARAEVAVGAVPSFGAYLHSSAPLRQT